MFVIEDMAIMGNEHNRFPLTIFIEKRKKICHAFFNMNLWYLFIIFVIYQFISYFFTPIIQELVGFTGS